MVANITTGKDVYGALAYNQEKVDRGDGKVLLTHIVREPADGRFNVAATAEDLLRWMPSHYRTEKPVVHVSLNPAPEDRLDDGQLAEIAGAYMERMGWGGQPYIVFKHTDIGREHIHIVSVQVAQDGRKINDSRRNERSVAVTEELEREYGLHPAKGRRRAASDVYKRQGERARDRPRRLHAGRPETPGGSGNKTGRGDIPLPDPRRVPGIAVLI